MLLRINPIEFTRATREDALIERFLISFLEKSTTTLWLNVPDKGAAINLPVSRAEKNFGSGNPQRTY
jgi:hypothetical protein